MQEKINPNSKQKEEKNKRETVMLIDSHALLHRGYHAMAGFATHDGRPTGALFGFVKMIIKAANDIKPEHIIAAYDLPKPTFRHLSFDDYKGHRASTHDDLKAQIDQSKGFCEALGIPLRAVEGFEADDVLGTLSKIYVEQGHDVMIISGDMDTMQLVNKNVKVYTLKKGVEGLAIFGEKEVLTRYGVTPKQISEYKGLVGDPSDNIPGVMGVGEKTAIKLIQAFETVDNLYNIIKTNPEKVKEVVSERILQKLTEGEEEAVFSKTLATIRLDVPVEIEMHEANWPQCVNIDKYKDLCDLYELRTLRNIFDKKQELNSKTYQSGTKNENKNTDSNSSGDINIDIKIDGLDIDSSKVEGREGETDKGKNLTDKQLIELQNMYILIDSEKLRPSFEEMVASLAMNYDTANYESVKENLFERLKQDDLLDYYNEVEKPVTKIIEHMEEVGMLIDVRELEIQSKKLSEIIKKLEKEIHGLAGVEFLISSPKQLGEVLYDKLQLGNKIKKTSTGKRTTNAEQLEKMKDEHPIIEKILYWREVSKLYGTYLEPLKNHMWADGRIHPHFIQAGAATGRFSCENPNVQNLPTKTELGQDIKKVFIAEKGYKLLSVDYSQIDLRAAAMLSGDEKLVEIFKNREDVHRGVAASVLHKKLDEVTGEERRKAKAINFGILYGMGVSALTEAMGSDRKEAQVFYDNYKENFSTLMKYLGNVKESTSRLGYTTTILNRRRYVPLIRSKLPFLKAQGERIAINAPIQGSSADILKLGMVDVYNEMQDYIKNGTVRMQLQIHDELVFEVRENIAEEVALKIEKILENVLKNKDKKVLQLLENYTSVPLEASVGIGDNLKEVK